MYNEVCLLLRKIGLRGTLCGFYYILNAILLALNDTSYLLNLTKRLYPEIASLYNVTPAQVERSMRSAIDLIWNKGNITILEEMVGYKIKHKPYVGEFIDIISGYFRSMIR